MTLKGYLDISEWDTELSRRLLILAEQDEALRLRLTELGGQRDQVRAEIKGLLHDQGITAGHVTVGSYDVELRQQKGRPHVDIETLKAFWPTAYEATVTSDQVEVLIIRALKAGE